MRRKLGPCCIAVALIMLATGCKASSTSTQDAALTGVKSTARVGTAVPTNGTGSDEGIDMTPSFDEDLGRVTLPYDRFALDQADVSVLKEAVNVSVALCARKQGIDFVASPLFDDVDLYHAQAFFGPWTTAQAEKFAFVEPMRDADLRANGYVPQDYGRPSDGSWEVVSAHNAPIFEKHEKELDACSDQASSILDPMRAASKSPWQTELWDVRDSILKNDEVKPVVEDLEDCLRDKGLKPVAGMPGYVDGYDVQHINEEQITLAVQTVECKEKVDFTRKVATVWARLQAPILTKYAKEVVAQGAANAQALSDAGDLINNNKDILKPM